MNFKVRCTKTIGDIIFTPDKIYQVIDGILRDNLDHIYLTYNSVQQINKDLDSQFELVEEEPKVSDFKVRCVQLNNCNGKVYKQGEVYYFKNGIMFDSKDRQVLYCSSFSNFEEFSKYTSSKFELITEPKPFTKADLRTGMRVELRNGDRLIFVDSDLKGFTHGDKSVYLDWYDNNLKYKHQLCAAPRLDIVKVFSTPTKFLINMFDINCETELLYQRTEPTYVTIAEAEAALTEAEGNKVEITDNEGNPLKK